MLIFLDEDFALMVIRRQIERTYRLVVSPGRPLDEAETQRAIDEWSVKASSLLEQYALGVFCMAQAQLITDVAQEVVRDIVRQTIKRQGVVGESSQTAAAAG